jgi:mRNA interferase MazF
VIPLTTKLTEDAAPLRIRVPAADGLKRDSDLLIDQIRAIDNVGLLQGPLTRVAPGLMERVEEAILAVLDIGGSFDPHRG